MLNIKTSFFIKYIIKNISILNIDNNINKNIDKSDLNFSLEEDDIYTIKDILNVSPESNKVVNILSIISFILCLIGLFGNIVSIIILNKKAMKKLSTNFYLLGLSITDTITLFFNILILINNIISILRIRLPQQTLNIINIIIIYIYPIILSTQVLSILITLTFTIDRYVYICHPYKSYKYCTRKNAMIILSILIVIVIIYSIPLYFETSHESLVIFDEIYIYKKVTEFGRNIIFIYIYHLAIYCIFIIFIPMTIIIILNILLIIEMIKSNRKHILQIDLNPSSNNEKCCLFFRKRGHSSDNIIPIEISNQISNKLSKKNKRNVKNDVTLTIIMLIVVFCICQIPSTILRLLIIFDSNIIFNITYIYSLDISNFLIVLNSTLNCILYILVGKKFRKEFLLLFKRKSSL